MQLVEVCVLIFHSKIVKESHVRRVGLSGLWFCGRLRTRSGYSTSINRSFGPSVHMFWEGLTWNLFILIQNPHVLVGYDLSGHTLGGEPTMESVIWHFVCKWSFYFFHLLTCRGVVESLEEDTRVWRSSEYCSNLYVDYDLSQKFIGKSLPRFNNVRAMCNHKRGLSDLEKLKATYVHTGGRFQV